ncbi:hypothetical protein [Microcoleus sp. BROC3]|uniref:hypothetical protein n=1 Tax=Microcoleus sp. BROC3 TaxID=3055323 RepID=UPI002FD2D53D
MFAEFFGANSFAVRDKKDERKQLVLFDVETEGGMVVPDRFIQDFGKLNMARVIYRGKLTGKFMDDLRKGKYGVDEGVVQGRQQC